MTKHFHEGELRLQNQVGMRQQIDVMTEHLMKDYMPDQHREFFEGLEYLFLGTVAKDGLPHTVFLTGPPKFASSPDPKKLIIQTGPRAGHVGFNGLATGQPVGVLGLDLSNRRRNRMLCKAMAIAQNISAYGRYPNAACPPQPILLPAATR